MKGNLQLLGVMALHDGWLLETIASCRDASFVGAWPEFEQRTWEANACA